MQYISELFSDRKKYEAETKAIATDLTDLVGRDERYEYASCVWCYHKINEAGGLSILCHPYWVRNYTYNVSDPLISKHFEAQPFDALEVISGYQPHEVESNILQVARYHEERSRGRKIPIVGVSDSHSCEKGKLLGRYYTIVFALSPKLRDLIQGGKNCYSVAIEELPNEIPRVYGPFRLVRYAQFLLREIFPIHQELCAEEGKLMLAYLSGDSDASAKLQALKGQTTDLLNHYWSK